MKTFFSSLILVLVFFSSQAQPKASANREATDSNRTYNYVVLTRNIQQLKPIFMAAEDLSIENGKQFGEFYVIVCGRAVKDLIDPETMESYTKDAHRIGVNLIGCGFSLDKFGIKEEKLFEGIKVVENGIQFNLELQKQGYISLSL